MGKIETDFRPRARNESKAFGFEYDRVFSEEEIRNDIVSYLGEYRFKLPKYDYQLAYSQGKLKSSFGDESMSIKAQRSIEKNRRLGDPIRRDLAELEGLNSLENQLKISQNGDTIVWASPPGPKKEGYGNYGFIYLGKVEKQGNQDVNLAMTAIRVENPSIENFNKALRELVFNSVYQNVGFQTPEQFLRSPFVINKNLDSRLVDQILKETFDFKPDRKEQERFNGLITRMRPLINDLIKIIQNGSSDKKLKAFYTLENYFIKLEEESRNQIKVTVWPKSDKSLNELTPYYSHRPPVVGGSCGSSGVKSNDIFNFGDSLSFLSEDKYGSREFECPDCHKKNIRPLNELLPKCQHCGSKKVAC